MAGPLRVLVVTEALEPCGVWVYTENLIRGLVRFGHRATVLTPGGSLLGRLEGSNGAKIITEPGVNSFLRRGGAARRTVRALGGPKPEIVHALTADAQAAAARIARSLGVPYVLTSHRFHKRPDPVRIGSRCARVIAVSEAIRENLVNDTHVAKELISIVPNGLDLSRYHVPPERPEGSIPVAGCVGRLVSDRGIAFLLEAAKLIRDAGHDIEYVIAGDGPGKNRLLELAGRLGLRERFTMSGGAADYSGVLPAMDIFVAPSLSEGLGVHIIEAMACGRPVVASSVGGIFTVVKDGKGGFLVPPRDPEAIAKVIISLIKDPHLRVAMGSYGRQQVESSFNLAKMLEGTEEAYRRAIQGS